jgi:hypothetical protein
MGSPEKFPRVCTGHDDKYEQLDRRVRRIEIWVPVFLGVAVIVTALCTMLFRLSVIDK